MADNIAVVEPTTDKEAIAKANAETIRKQGEQDISGQSTSPTIDVEISAGNALDRLRDAAIREAEPTEEEKAAAEKEAAEKAAAEAAAKAAAAGTPPPEPTEAEKLAAAAALETAEKAAAAAKQAEEIQKRSDEIFKSAPTLPPNASPKSGEAFSAVKRIAAEQIGDLTRQIADLTKANQELTTKASAPIPQEITQELETLRDFRAKLDVETDPRWKSFDAKINENNEFIYAQLKKAPTITAAVIDEIKKYGGPANVNMEKILATVADPTLKRTIEASLKDIEMTDFQKSQAIEKAKSDIKKYQEDRSKEWQESLNAHNTTTKKALDELTGKIPWLNQVKVAATASEDQKKAAEAHNAYAANMKKELDAAATDDTPEMRALLLVGMVNSFRFEEALKAEVTAHNAAKESLKTIEATHKKQVDELNATISRLKASGTSRLRTSAAPAGGATNQPEAPKFDESAGSALDRLRQQKIEASRGT